MRRLGQSGTPDPIRSTVASLGTRPQRSRLRAAIVVGMLLPWDLALAQQGTPARGSSASQAYISALLLLGRHGFAALALTLGILCFAVITAILLVRTRRQLAEVTNAARDQSIAARSAIDRAYALLMSEPQILVAWAA